jgi:hypothetical protein
MSECYFCGEVFSELNRIKLREFFSLAFSFGIDVSYFGFQKFVARGDQLRACILMNHEHSNVGFKGFNLHTILVIVSM